MNIKLIRKNRSKWILVFCISISILVIPVALFNLYIYFSTPEEYTIKNQTTIDYQAHNECSGYASAYVLRSLGIDTTGLELYNSIPTKNTDGTVSPKHLLEFLNDAGYIAKLHSGSIYQLKNQVSKGTPVIVFVKTGPNDSYYHYLPVVGYDKETIYTADSLKYKQNSDNEYYNRIIKLSDFENMWETGIFRKNTYITIRLK